MPYINESGNIWLLIANILLVLISMNVYRAPAVALMPDITPEENRSKANSFINILGGCGMYNNAGCSENNLINRYELNQESRIAKLESEIALRDANIYNDQKSLELYKYFDGEIKRIDRTLAEQAVYNATQTGAISCIQGQIMQLQSLTKLVVPNSSVCPGWGNVTITPSTTTTT